MRFRARLRKSKANLAEARRLNPRLSIRSELWIGWFMVHASKRLPGRTSGFFTKPDSLLIDRGAPAVPANVFSCLSGCHQLGSDSLCVPAPGRFEP